MKQEITKTMFFDSFRAAGRQDNFSYNALCALYDYLDEIENYELDVIAICCDYQEDTIANVMKNYRLKSIEELEHNTTVIYKNKEVVLYEIY